MTEAAKNRTWHKRLRAQLKREQHAQERHRLAELRQRITLLQTDRRRAVCRAKTLCRTERARIKAADQAERAAIRREREELKRRALELRGRVKATRLRARRLCKLRTERGKSKHAETLAALAQQRADHRALLANLRELDTRVMRKTVRGERRAESDDAVRSNIPEELVPVFNSVRGYIREKAGRSRTEAFLEWVEAHPEEVWAMRQRDADRALRRLLADEQRQSVRLRKTGARLRELEAVPF